jgi:hypothetical protein
MLERARRRPADDYRACGALSGLQPGRSTRTLGVQPVHALSSIANVETTYGQ